LRESQVLGYSQPLFAPAMGDVAGRIISRAAAREGAIIRFELPNTGICGAGGVDVRLLFRDLRAPASRS
jgi:hypothetical protein